MSEATAIKFARVCAEKDKRYALLLDSHTRLVEALTWIQQVSCGELELFNDEHDALVEIDVRANAAMRKAEKVGA